MADLLASANGWLQAQRHAHATREVTYRRGVDALDLLATVGATRWESELPNGTRVFVESRDFLIRSVDLDFGAGPVEPARGDAIEEAGRVYEVLPFGPDEEHWRYSDPDRLTLRIHTKSV